MIRVLLVEDDAMIREMTRIFLESQKRFEVVCAASGEEALAHAKDPFDVILLDILLPDTNGMQLCQTLRSGHHCPIIFTSCLDDVDTIVHALELGGDDFLTKPYDNKVLVARILANVRRVQMDAAEPSLRGYTCPAFRLDADNRSVHCQGEDIRQNQDSLCIFDCGKPVCDHKCCTILCQFFQRILHDFLTFIVKCTRRLIKDQDRWIL